jgi:hypothetical protein
MRFVVQVIIIGCGIPDFLRSSCSGSVFSALVVSVSMSVALLRSAKKLLANTDFGTSLTTADVGTGLVDFLAVCEVLLETCLVPLYIMEVVILGR